MNNNLKIALEKALENEFSYMDDLDNPYTEYEFSPQFEKKIKKITPKAEFTYVNVGRMRIRKAMIAAAIALLALAVTGCAIAAHYIVEWNETQNDEQGTLDVTFNVSGDGPHSSEPFSPKHPEGYTITNEFNDPVVHSIEYEDDKGHSILFLSQENIETAGLSINNEGEEFKEINIRGQKGYYFYNEGFTALTWTDDRYLYQLQGTCEMDVLMDMINE